jgi:hypothetical protein
MTFCPFCGAFHLAGDPADQAKVPGAVYPTGSVGFALEDLKEVPPSSDTDEGEDE